MSLPTDRTGAATTPDGGLPPPVVVVGVDGSPGSRAALVYAFTTAARRGADLEVIGTVSVPGVWVGGYPLGVPEVAAVRADMESRVAGLVDEVRADPVVQAVAGTEEVRARVVVSMASAAQALVDASDGAELLVVGSRGRSAVRSLLLGSVALHCVAQAHCPVVVVHPVPAGHTQEHTVVAGLDGSAASRAALVAALEEAERRGTDVAAVAAFEMVDQWVDLSAVTVPSDEEVAQEVQRGAGTMVEEAVAEHRARHDGRAPAVRVVVAEAPAGDVLVREAELLVVGSRGHGTLHGLLVGSVALACAMHGAGPVMVVHPQPARTACWWSRRRRRVPESSPPGGRPPGRATHGGRRAVRGRTSPLPVTCARPAAGRPRRGWTPPVRRRGGRCGRRDHRGAGVGRRVPGPLEDGALRRVERELPEPAAGQVRVRVSCCGVCRTDLHLAEGDLAAAAAGRRRPATRSSGAVDALGAGATRLRGRRPGRRGVAGRHRRHLPVLPARARRTCACTRVHRLGRRRWLRRRLPGRRALRLPAARHVRRRAGRAAAVRRDHRLPRPAARRRATGRPRWASTASARSAHLTAQLALRQGLRVHVLTRGDRNRALARGSGSTPSAGAADAAARTPRRRDPLRARPASWCRSRSRALDRGGTLAVAGIWLSDIPAPGLRRRAVPGTAAAQRHRQHPRRRRGVPAAGRAGSASGPPRPATPWPRRDLRARRPGRRSVQRRRRPAQLSPVRTTAEDRAACRQQEAAGGQVGDGGTRPVSRHGVGARGAVVVLHRRAAGADGQPGGAWSGVSPPAAGPGGMTTTGQGACATTC